MVAVLHSLAPPLPERPSVSNPRGKETRRTPGHSRLTWVVAVCQALSRHRRRIEGSRWSLAFPKRLLCVGSHRVHERDACHGELAHCVLLPCLEGAQILHPVHGQSIQPLEQLAIVTTRGERLLGLSSVSQVLPSTPNLEKDF